MPSVKLNKDVFEQLVGKKLPIDQLKDRISYLGTDLEKIEGNEINVEVFPNRPDMLSEQGFARAFATFIGARKGLQKYHVKKSGVKVIVDKSVSKVRPKTACAVVKNLTLNDEKIREIIQIQEKLHVTYGRHRRKVAIGIYPYEKIKAPIHYTAKDPDTIEFQPLEYPESIKARDILQMHPAGKTYGHLLEEHNLFPFWIDAHNEVMSMPPIINSHHTGRVNEQTKDIFIECSGFDYRILSKCVNILVTALADMGGEIYSVEIEYPDKILTSPNLDPITMKFDLDYCNKLLGLELNEADVKHFFLKMGYNYEKGEVFIPAYRTDILHQIDLVEDVAIAYGYDKFTAEIPNISTIGNEDPFYRFKERIGTLLTGLGMMEIVTYHLANIESNKTMNHDLELVELSNSKSIDYAALRAWLLPNLMKVLSENKDNGYPQEIFEIGVVFRKDETQETNVLETSKLAVGISHAKANYTHIKQVFETILSHLEMHADYEILEHSSFIHGRGAVFKVKGVKLGYMGEIHPQVLSNFGIEMPVVTLEIDLTQLYKLFSSS